MVMLSPNDFFHQEGSFFTANGHVDKGPRNRCLDSNVDPDHQLDPGIF